MLSDSSLFGLIKNTSDIQISTNLKVSLRYTRGKGGIKINYHPISTFQILNYKVNNIKLYRFVAERTWVRVHSLCTTSTSSTSDMFSVVKFQQVRKKKLG